MNPIEELRSKIAEQLPDARTSLAAPATKTGSWWLDIAAEGQAVTVEWRADKGFGISTPPYDGYGEGPDECYPGVTEVGQRVVAILQTRVGTKEAELSLAEIRSALRLSQTEVAKRLSVRQNAISRLERRDDVRLSTLRSYLRALGGHLEVRAVFPTWSVFVRGDKEVIGSGDPEPALPPDAERTDERSRIVGKTGRPPTNLEWVDRRHRIAS